MITSHGSSPREPSIDDEAAVLGPVAGRVQDADLHVAERDLLPVRERLVRILGLRGGVDVDGNAVLEREPPVPGDVVGVRVRLEDARDPHVPLLGLLEVGLDRVRGIDDHGLTRGLVADQVGRAAEIVVDELPKLHEKDPNSDPGARRTAKAAETCPVPGTWYMSERV